MPKSSNAKYISFIIITVIMVLFFILINSLLKDSRKVRNEGYDTSLKLNGYIIKVNNACYDSSAQRLTFDLYIKSEYDIATDAETPYISEIESNAKKLDFSISEHEKNNYAHTITVNQVDKKFYYVRIKISSKGPDIQPEPTVDEFGNIITQEVIKGEVVNKYIYIDYRNVSKASGKKEVVATVSQHITTAAPTTTTSPEVTKGTITSATSPVSTGVTKQTTKTSKFNTSSSASTAVDTTSKTKVTTPKKDTSSKRVSTFKKTTTKKVTSAPKTTTKKKITTKKPITTTKKTTTKTTPTLKPIKLTGLKLSTVSPNNTVYIKVSESTHVKPVFIPAQATNKKVYWESNREDRAVIDKNGKVTGRSPGTVIIKCTSDDGRLTAACMIVVTD